VFACVSPEAVEPARICSDAPVVINRHFETTASVDRKRRPGRLGLCPRLLRPYTNVAPVESQRKYAEVFNCEQCRTGGVVILSAFLEWGRVR
jgi:hypothetical protein